MRRTLERLPAYFVDLLLEYMSRNGGRGRQINPSCPINGILVGRFRVAVAFQILGQQDPEIVLFVLKPRELEGAVKILAETRDHRYGGLLEYRRTAKGWKRSLPTGKITLAIKNSAVEMSVVSAFAEILEEVGFVGDEHSEAKIIGESDWEADLIQNGSVVTVLVRGLDGAAEMSPDPDEEIVPELLTLSSLFAFATTKFNPACPSQPAQARDPSLLAVAAMLASLAKVRKEDPEYLDRELHLISEMLDGTPSFSSDGEPISGDPEDDEYSRTPWFNSEDPRNR
ncbi:MAG: hypothetical protein ABIG32_03205 [Candidatus Uhrbacteria bacterium]